MYTEIKGVKNITLFSRVFKLKSRTLALFCLTCFYFKIVGTVTVVVVKVVSVTKMTIFKVTEVTLLYFQNDLVGQGVP